MKIILYGVCAFLCALSIDAFPTPKPDVPQQCIDPTFACQDLESARTCKVVKECIHDVWENMGAPQDNDEICDICKEMVKEARDQLLSNMTQEEIKEVFEGSCKLLPIELVADACIKVVDEIIPQLVEMLASRMDPNMVCTVSGMCNALSDNKMSKVMKLFIAQSQDTICQECTKMLVDLKAFINDSTEAEAQKYVENICDQKAPKFLCNLFMNSYFHSLYVYAKTTDAETMCGAAGVCPKVCHPKEVNHFNDDLTCEFCEHVLQHIKDLMTTNSTLEEFRTALLNFCKHVGSFSDKCTSLVDDYADMLFDYIKKLDTKGMCTLIGLCNNEKCAAMPLVKVVPALEAKRKISSIPLVKLQPAIPVPSNSKFQPLVKLVPATFARKKNIVSESNDIFQSKQPLELFPHPLAFFQGNTECAFCKAVSIFLEMDLNGDYTEETVKRHLPGICDKYVGQYVSECNKFLNKYSPKFRHALAKGVKMTDVCDSLKVCVEDKKSELNVKVISKVKEGPFCDLCKDAMNEVENTLSDPATKEKLEDLADQACNILPESLRDDCVSFCKTNVDALLDILQQEMKPDNICPALRLCDKKLRIDVSQRVKDLECDVCKDVVSSLREKLSDPDAKKVVLSFLEEGCARLPGSLAGECKTFIDENIDTVFGMIIQELDPDTVCSMFKLCPASLMKPKKFNDMECDLCKEVVGKVEDLVKDKKTEEEIKSALEKVCSYLPSSISPKCTEFAANYTETLITLLMAEMNPDMVCAALNICPKTLNYPVWKLKAKSLECEGCQYLFHYAQSVLRNSDNQEEVKNVLKKMCDWKYLPQKIHEYCETIVVVYGNSLLDILAQEMDPNTMCSLTQMCPSQTKIFHKFSTAVFHKPKKINDMECDLCKEVVGKVEDMVKDKKTEEEIKNALDKVCSYLESEKCKEFVDQYVETLITLLMQEIDPDMICATLNLCPKTVGYPAWQSKAADLECQGCQDLLHFVQEQLSNADTQEEVKNVLKKICDFLPGTLSTNCEGFVNEYGSSLLVLVAQEIDPSTLCNELKLCSNQTKIFQQTTTDILHPFNSDECSICTTVVDYIDKLLEKDDVDKEIAKLVEKVCTVLPASYIDQCTSMLEAYAPYILQMIGQVADSKEVCQEIDLCSRPPGHVHLLGGNKCTFGPSYWCKSSAHAAACKAEMFCKDQVRKI